MEDGESVVRLEEISVEVRNRAVRKALKEIPVKQLRTILADCGLTKDEQDSILEHCDGADLTWISEKLNVSDRTLDRRRASALDKLRRELEQQ